MISELHLNNFRIHENLACNSGSDIVLIEGPNGIGKTSILEAISFMAPGRGMKHVLACEAMRHGTDSWTVFCRMASSEIGIEYKGKRTIKIDGKVARSSSELLNLLRILWITPSEDAILSASKSVRRKFLDRLCYNFYPSHAENIISYEHLSKTRLQILKGDNPDKLWLDQVENNMVGYILKINEARRSCITRLSGFIAEYETGFITPAVDLICQTLSDSAEKILSLLAANRHTDGLLGRAMYGPHRADFQISNAATNIAALYSSTGELKLMLLALMIGQVKTLNMQEGITPVLLLDDIFSHLDDHYSRVLASNLGSIDAQVWVTGTDMVRYFNNLEYKNFVKILI